MIQQPKLISYIYKKKKNVEQPTNYCQENKEINHNRLGLIQR